MHESKHKETVVTFKADSSLLEALKGVRNRSEFIRSAILAALDSYCPLCGGSGVLTPNQKNHWDEFSRHHPLQECGQCHEVHLICAETDTAQPPTKPRRKAGSTAAAKKNNTEQTDA